jgi:hypothetical protein
LYTFRNTDQIFGICDQGMITATSMSSRSKRTTSMSKRNRDENAFTSIQSARYIQRKQKKHSTIDNYNSRMSKMIAWMEQHHPNCLDANIQLKIPLPKPVSST